MWKLLFFFIFSAKLGEAIDCETLFFNPLSILAFIIINGTYLSEQRKMFNA